MFPIRARVSCYFLIFIAVYFPSDIISCFADHSVPTNNEGKDLTCCLDLCLTLSDTLAVCSVSLSALFTLCYLLQNCLMLRDISCVYASQMLWHILFNFIVTECLHPHTASYWSHQWYYQCGHNKSDGVTGASAAGNYVHIPVFNGHLSNLSHVSQFTVVPIYPLG